ncbi:Auxin-responsive protein SAUR68 [Bienertia sinuspersici]
MKHKNCPFSSSTGVEHYSMYNKHEDDFLTVYDSLTYLKSKMFTELFKMAEEEFGIAKQKANRTAMIQHSWSIHSL